MKTVLYPTDCSIESARALKEWLSRQIGEPVNVTIVQPYDIMPDAPLAKASFKEAKQLADQRLSQWVQAAGIAGKATIDARSILGGAEVLIKSFLALYPYDLLLVDENGFGLTNGVTAFLNQTLTNLEITVETDYAVLEQAA
ncbi:hypothetical protein GCM10023189_30800 [Nibrella saemangeumensis]|uniref:Universal stress protein n=1 Tax=Nibrella saemangeumensis TaxID=1084526 RepID=A0ABP8N1E7_9BACT